jgi:hypothetical protein
MRDGTGTSFEPMSRDWFTTDPRRDAPNAGVEFDVDAIVVVVTATHPVHRLPSSEEPDPIRSDPTAPEHHGWTPNDALGDDSLAGEPIDRGTRTPMWTRTSSPSLPCALAARKTNNHRNASSSSAKQVNVPGRDGGAHGEGHLPSIARAWICRPGERSVCGFPNEIREESRVRAGTQILNCDSSIIDRTFGFFYFFFIEQFHPL